MDVSSGTSLDLWKDSYAQRAHNLRASEIRALFSVVSRPEVVSLAGGMPNIADLPLQELAESAQKIVRDHGTQLLQYGNGRGWAPICEMICEVMAVEGISGDPDNVVVTTGSQQALDLITQLFIDPGDVILAESPSYVGALGVFRAYQADVVHVPMDEHGIIPEAFEQSVQDCRKQGKRIKYFYAIPNYHNPMGTTYTLERRQALIELCRKYEVLILEDNPYGLLGFDGKTNVSLCSLAPDIVVYLGSFSKIFAPGFRIGWAYCPPAVRDKLVVASESAILCPSMVGQMCIDNYLRNYDWRGQIKAYRKMYEGRRGATMKALEKYMPMCSWTVPDGGFYTWVKLPEGVDSKVMLTRAVSELVAYTPGTAFYANGAGRQYLRICYSYPPEDVITEGVRRLSRVVRKEAELAQLFGTNAVADEQ